MSNLWKDRVGYAKKGFEFYVHRYLELFCEKQGFVYDKREWVGNIIGEVICINDMLVKLSDIRIDIDRNITKGIFSEWYWTVTESDLPYINYNSWVMGLRHKDLKQSENGNTSAI